MPISRVIELSVGMIVFYYILSLTVSSITSKISEWMQLRASVLEDTLRGMLTGDGSGAEGLFDNLMQDPSIKILEQKYLSRLAFWQVGKYQQENGQVKTRKVEKIPASALTLALFNQVFPEGEEETTLDKIEEQLQVLPDGEMKESITSILRRAEGNLEKGRQQVETWFDNTMENVSAIYRVHARRIAFVVAALVVLIVDADTVAVVNRLWAEPALQAAAAAKAEELVTTQDADSDVAELIGTVEGLELPIFWSNLSGDLGRYVLSRIPGWIITWFALSLGSSFWYDMLKKIKTIPGAKTSESAAA